MFMIFKNNTSVITEVTLTNSGKLAYKITWLFDFKIYLVLSTYLCL